MVAIPKDIEISAFLLVLHIVVGRKVQQWTSNNVGVWYIFLCEPNGLKMEKMIGSLNFLVVLLLLAIETHTL